MPLYTYYCPNCTYAENKLMTFQEYDLYKAGELEKLAGSFDCPDCQSPLLKSIIDMKTVEMRIKDLEEDGRRPSGKMMKEKEPETNKEN